MYVVQSKKRNSDLREGWTSYVVAYCTLSEAMEAMAYHAEENPSLMHRVVQKIDRVIAMMPELDTSYHPKEETEDGQNI